MSGVCICDLHMRGNNHIDGLNGSWLRHPHNKHLLLSPMSVFSKNGLRLEVHAELMVHMT